MRSAVGRLIILIAEMLDRSLLTVPDIDEHRAPEHSPARLLPFSQLSRPTLKGNPK